MDTRRVVLDQQPCTKFSATVAAKHIKEVRGNSGAGSNLKVEGHNFRRAAPENFFLYCAPPLFRGAQGTIEKCRAR